MLHRPEPPDSKGVPERRHGSRPAEPRRVAVQGRRQAQPPPEWDIETVPVRRPDESAAATSRRCRASAHPDTQRSAPRRPAEGSLRLACRLDVLRGEKCACESQSHRTSLAVERDALGTIRGIASPSPARYCPGSTRCTCGACSAWKSNDGASTKRVPASRTIGPDDDPGWTRRRADSSGDVHRPPRLLSVS